MRSFYTVGLARLRALVGAAPADAVLSSAVPSFQPDLPSLRRLVDELEAEGPGLVLVMGKGGVGKTTLAAAIAVALADRGHPVRLSNTTPPPTWPPPSRARSPA